MDGIILAVATAVLRIPLFLALGLGGAGIFYPRSGLGFSGLFVFGAVSLTVSIAYEAYFLSVRGATPGKMALGLRVIRPGGGEISPGLAVTRYFARLLSGMILAIGYLMAAFDVEKRALHDRLCDTRVIRTR